jgi:1,2-diacylglycerol 3-alpha-glucosyltransferase
MIEDIASNEPSATPWRCAVLFPRFGPYHVARLDAAGKVFKANGCELIGIETATMDSTYEWDVYEGGSHFKRLTVFPAENSTAHSRRETRRSIMRELDKCAPDVVAIPGWQFVEARSSLMWCRQSKAGAVLMSESSWHDFPRHWLKESAKKLIIRQYQSALVGGSVHAEYVVRLGMNPDKIRLGYDAVNNDYFRIGADAARQNTEATRAKFKLPKTFILASGRFIHKKNFVRLLQAFSAFRAGLEANAVWELVLCGDGQLRDDIHAECNRLGLNDVVHFPGFVQYENLPAYYGMASAFVHPSTTEQWGLVVNEAMAAGLPVAVSSRCGSAPTLVEIGKNGNQFDPYSVADMTRALHDICSDAARMRAMGSASQERIKDWGVERFGTSLWEAAKIALAERTQKTK